MRKQYYFRASSRGLLAWDVDRLVALTQHFPCVEVPLAGIRELDQPFSSEHDGTPTWQDVTEHVRLIQGADLSFPIILSADGGVMDGMHRVAKAVLLGRTSIRAVRFTNDPEPDHVGVQPENLPYDASSPDA